MGPDHPVESAQEFRVGRRATGGISWASTVAVETAASEIDGVIRRVRSSGQRKNKFPGAIALKRRDSSRDKKPRVAARECAHRLLVRGAITEIVSKGRVKHGTSLLAVESSRAIYAEPLDALDSDVPGATAQRFRDLGQRERRRALIGLLLPYSPRSDVSQ